MELRITFITVLLAAVLILFSSGCLEEEDDENDRESENGDQNSGPKLNMTFLINNLDPAEVDHRFVIHFDGELRMDSTVPPTTGSPSYEEMYGFTIPLSEGKHSIKAEVPEGDSEKTIEFFTAEDALYIIQYGMETNPDVNIAYVGINMNVSGFNQLPLIGI
jgi:hypothetical protein